MASNATVHHPMHLSFSLSLFAPSPNIYIHAIGLLGLFIAMAVIIIYSFYCVHFAMVT